MRRPFFILVLGQAVSALGDPFATMATALLVYELTGSELALGGIAVATFLPQTIARLLGAPLIDRYRQNRLMALLDLLRCVAYLVPPLLALGGRLSLWHLYVLAAIAGAARGLFDPALFSMVPSLVPPDRLSRANSILQSAINIGGMLGPALAGLLVTRVGAHAALIADALTFAVSGLSLLRLPIAAAPPRRLTLPAYLGDLAEGLRFFAGTPALLNLTLLTALAAGGNAAIGAMLLPWVQQHLDGGPSAFGALLAAFSLGYASGAVLLSLLSLSVPRRVIILGALLLFTAAGAAMAFVPPRGLPLALFLWGLTGVGAAVSLSVTYTLLQELVPPQLLGRIIALRLAIAYGAYPLGGMVGAVAAGVVGLPGLFLLAGLLPAAAVAWAFRLPAWRALP